MGMNRRDFITASAATASSFVFPSIGKASAQWASLPTDFATYAKYKVLEIYLVGGASMWENFWVSHDGPTSKYGNAVKCGHLNWRGLEEQVNELSWQHSCPAAPSYSLETEFFGTTENGLCVSWGPSIAPLWRSDIINRSRMVVTQHADEIHPAAACRVLTGRRFGGTRAAGLGASIQRHFQSLDQDQDIPYSYVFVPDYLGRPDYFNIPTYLGRHPGSAKPLAIKVGSELNGLSREGISPNSDALFAELRKQYRDLLRWQGISSPIRSANFATYNYANNYLVNAKDLDTLLGGNTLVANPENVCAINPNTNPDSSTPIDNHTLRSLQAAAKMLNNGARHVTVVDDGFSKGSMRDSNMAYDLHGNNDVSVTEMTSAHLFNMAKSLESIISDGGIGLSAGISDMISLDDTLVVIHSEFNRTPNADSDTFGRQHFPSANIAILIGGPVTSRGIKGHIGLIDGVHESAAVEKACSPTDIHAAVMMAAGVDPMHPDSFTTGDDFSSEISPGGATNASAIRENLYEKVLGNII